MSSTDLAFWHLIGAILYDATVGSMIQSVFYGIFMALIIFSTNNFVRQKSKEKTNIAMLAITLCMFTISSTVWVLDLASVVEMIRIIHLHDTPRSPESITLELNQSAGVLYDAAQCVFVVNLILSDCVAVWRAYVLWPAATMIFVGCTANFNKDTAFCDDMRDIMSYVGLGLSLLINLVATSSIGITAWRHRQSILRNLGQSSRRTQVEKILILLIESSLLYCLANAILIVCKTIYLPGPNALSQLMWPISTHIAGIYPTTILHLVALKRTIWDSLSDFPQATLSSLHFAAGHVTEETGDQQPPHVQTLNSG